MARSAVRTTIALLAAAGIATAAAATAAPATPHGGRGALKAALVPTAPSALDSQCQEAGSGAAQGFAVLNAPGKPGRNLTRVLGTVSLKKAPQHDATFDVQLATGGSCTDTGVDLTTNGVGDGTAKFSVSLPSDSTAKTFYVVLTQPTTPALPIFPSTAELYASKAVTLS